MPLEELRGGTSASAGTPTYYVFAGGQRVASLEGSTYTYYHQDHLGGTALATDSTGTVVQLYDYYPYGSELLDSQPTGASVPSEHSFTDKELDDDLGLYYFEARWYDSDIGRFSSQDPAQLDNRVFKLIQDPQSLNFYAYSRNNPVNITDPTGELSTSSFIKLFTAPGMMNLYVAGRSLAQSMQYTNPITSNFLEYSLMLNPSDVTITEANQAAWGNVVDSIKGSENYNNKIDELISEAEVSGSNSLNYSTADDGGGFRLDDSSDLKMSLGTVTMGVTGSKGDDGSWDLDVSITDTYHFDAGLNYEGGAAYNYANDVASAAQGAGLISPFDETINFSTTHE